MKRIEIHWVNAVPNAESITGKVRILEGDSVTDMKVSSTFMIERTTHLLRRYPVSKDGYLPCLSNRTNLLIGTVSDAYLHGLQAEETVYIWEAV